MAGIIKANAVQYGDHGTPTNNFVLQTNVDGTSKFSRGNVGALTQDIWSVTAGGKMQYVQAPILPAMSTIRVNTANGYGSGATCIPRFLNITNGVNGAVLQGTDITMVDSASLGTSFTVNVDGNYAITYAASFTGNDGIGLSLNSNQLSTAVFLITASHLLVCGPTPQTNQTLSFSVTIPLLAGDIIRPHTAGTATGANKPFFIMSRIS